MSNLFAMIACCMPRGSQDAIYMFTFQLRVVPAQDIVIFTYAVLVVIDY